MEAGVGGAFKGRQGPRGSERSRCGGRNRAWPAAAVGPFPLPWWAAQNRRGVPGQGRVSPRRSPRRKRGIPISRQPTRAHPLTNSRSLGLTRALPIRVGPDASLDTSADQALVRAVQARDPPATDALVQRLRCVSGVLAALNHRAGGALGPEDLGDLTQDTLALIWARLTSYNGQASL